MYKLFKDFSQLAHFTVLYTQGKYNVSSYSLCHVFKMIFGKIDKLLKVFTQLAHYTFFILSICLMPRTENCFVNPEIIFKIWIYIYSTKNYAKDFGILRTSPCYLE